MNWMRRHKQPVKQEDYSGASETPEQQLSEGPYRTAPRTGIPTFAQQMKDLATTSHPERIRDLVEEVKVKITAVAEKGGFNLSHDPRLPKDSITTKMLIEALRAEGLKCVFRYPNLSSSTDLEISWDKV